MNWFQIIAMIVVGALFLVSLTAVLRGAASRRDGLLWMLVFALAGVSIARPDLTQRLARALGIRRGADLVFYSAVVVMMIGFLMTYSQLRRLQRELTLVVRHIAKRDAAVREPAEERSKRDGADSAADSQT